MNDAMYLDHLIAQMLHQQAALQPRRAARFEPRQPADQTGIGDRDARQDDVFEEVGLAREVTPTPLAHLDESQTPITPSEVSHAGSRPVAPRAAQRRREARAARDAESVEAWRDADTELPRLSSNAVVPNVRTERDERGAVERAILAPRIVPLNTQAATEPQRDKEQSITPRAIPAQIVSPLYREEPAAAAPTTAAHELSLTRPDPSSAKVETRDASAHSSDDAAAGEALNRRIAALESLMSQAQETEPVGARLQPKRDEERTESPQRRNDETAKTNLVVPDVRPASNAPRAPVQSTVQPIAQPIAEPTIQVTIGRIEVRVAQPSPTVAARNAVTPKLSLDDYLRQREGG